MGLTTIEASLSALKCTGVRSICRPHKPAPRAAATATAEAAGAIPLVDAAERGNLTEVRALIKQGSNINAARVDGLTALHAAVYTDRLDVVETLLAAGARATATDRYGATPLYLVYLAAVAMPTSSAVCLPPEQTRTASMPAVRPS